MPTAAPSYLRFVLQRKHADSGVNEGLFSTGYALRDDDETPFYDRDTLAGVLTWFDDNMKVPTRFNRTASKGCFDRNTKGISWFKASSWEHIEKMRDMAAVLAEHGHLIDEIRTERPGYIVYEDDVQIVAEPYADTVTA